MGWKPNLPDKLARGVTVSARKGAGGRPYVMVTLWADVLIACDFVRGLNVEVLEGEGEDAGRLLIRRAGAASGPSVKELKTAGTSTGGNCLSLSVHWPAYTAPFGAETAPHEVTEEGLVITMPAVAAGEQPLFLPKDFAPRIREIQVECQPVAAEPPAPADAAPEPGGRQRLRLIAEGLTGVLHRYLSAFLDHETGALTWSELAALHDQEVSGNTMRMKLAALRPHLEAAGWALVERGVRVHLVEAENAPACPPPPPAPLPAPAEAAPPPATGPGAPPWLGPAIGACKSAKGRDMLRKLAAEGSVTLSGVIYAFRPAIKESYATVLISEMRHALKAAGWGLVRAPDGLYSPEPLKVKA